MGPPKGLHKRNKSGSHDIAESVPNVSLPFVVVQSGGHGRHPGRRGGVGGGQVVSEGTRTSPRADDGLGASGLPPGDHEMRLIFACVP